MSQNDKPGQTPDLTPQGNAPSWVDEVLGSSRATAAAPAPPTLSGPEDLKLPQTPPPPPHARQDDWVSVATRGQAKTPQVPTGPAPTITSSSDSAQVLRDFVQPLSTPQPDQRRVAAWPESRQSDSWGGPPHSPAHHSNVSQQKLIAGLLAIFLGSFGVHKFYLGLTSPGLVILGVNIGVWILAFVLGLLLFVFGLFITLPVAGFVSTVLGVLGLVEGIIYLTKSDADFQREYLVGKKPWL